jgi:hypothetical protein
VKRRALLIGLGLAGAAKMPATLLTRADEVLE